MTWAVDLETIFRSFVTWIKQIIGLLDRVMVAPYVSVLTLFIVGLFIGLTIAMFVRSGKT